MSKIVEAVNKMIENRDKIKEVIPSQDHTEFYFNYGKYKWSIMEIKSDYALFLYKDDNLTLDFIANNTDELLQDGGFIFVSYRTSEIKTREATESFSELYNIVKDRVFGADDILDSIINS